MTNDKANQAVVPEIPESVELISSAFDYEQIEDATSREKLQDSASKIRDAHQNIRLEMLQVGKELLAAKDLLGHGQWGAWLQAEFSMSTRTAQNFMAVAKTFPDLKNESLSYLTTEAMYLLASKNTPEEVREQVLERVEQGENLDRKAIREMIELAKPREKGARPERLSKAFYGTLQGGHVESLVQYLREQPNETRGELIENLKRLLAAVEG